MNHSKQQGSEIPSVGGGDLRSVIRKGLSEEVTCRLRP